MSTAQSTQITKPKAAKKDKVVVPVVEEEVVVAVAEVKAVKAKKEKKAKAEEPKEVIPVAAEEPVAAEKKEKKAKGEKKVKAPVDEEAVVPVSEKKEKAKGEKKVKAPKDEKVKKADKPKSTRTSSPYILFCTDVRPSVKAANPDATFGELGRIMGQQWATLGDDDKAVYVTRAAELKAAAAPQA